MTSNTPLWKSNQISYLINEKFPSFRMMSLSSGKSVRLFGSDQVINDVAAFKLELEKKSLEEITTLVEDSKNEQVKKHRLALEKLESEAFFNQSYTNADFEYWSRISYWTLEEAVALSLGKEPKFVTWEILEKYLDYSTFKMNFSKKREEVNRAKVMGQLAVNTVPANFVAWAERMRFDLPLELVTKVKELGVQVADWKSISETQQETISIMQKRVSLADENIAHERKKQSEYIARNVVDLETPVKNYSSVISTRDQDIVVLNNKISELEAVLSNKSSKLKNELSARERESFLKLILGLAMKGYRYDPKSTRSKEIKDIADDLREIDLSLDEDTIRKYLNEAKALFSDKLNRTE